MGRARGVAWVMGGYLARTIPSAAIAARAVGARNVLERASATTSEGDAHLLLAAEAPPVASALAMASDVAKAALVMAAARRARLSPGLRAATGVAAVAGHAFPFYARRFAGRGLAAAAGVTLVELPGAMVVAGSVLVAAKAMGHTGVGSTLGFASIPVVAAALGRPRAVVALGAGVLGVILARRLMGIRDVAARDGWTKALANRLLLDLDRPRRAAAD
jgi:glycerol-3-phosphate acyltransferase PlsY